MGMAKRQNTSRRFHGGGRRPDKRRFRQEEAIERNDAWAKLSPQAQLKALNDRFGEERGASNQRIRILAKINKPKQVEIAQPQTNTVSGDRVKAKDRRAQERQERPSK